MRLELQQIPPAPRQPRWPPVLWVAWPLAFLAFALSVYGGAITLMFHYAFSGKPADDRRLDGHGLRAEATVTEVSPTGATVGGQDAAWVHFTFTTADGQSGQGKVLAAAADYRAGQAASVDYLADQPHVNRLTGTRLNHVRDWSRALWWCLVLPGLAALLAWIWHVGGARRLLARGDVADAEILRVEMLPWILPSMLGVAYRFRDHRARETYGRHWVRARSLLGSRLRAEPPPQRMPVIHDRARPQRSRMVCAADFEGGPGALQPSTDNEMARWFEEP